MQGRGCDTNAVQSNLAKRLFEKRQFCSKRSASREFRSLCANCVVVSLSERFSQILKAAAYRGSTVYEDSSFQAITQACQQAW